MNLAVFAVIAVAAFGAGGCVSELGLFSDHESATQQRAFAFADRCVGCGTVASIDLLRFGERRRRDAALGNIIGGDFERSQYGVAGSNADGSGADTLVDVVNSSRQLRPENVDVYEIFVRMDDGRHYVIEQLELDGIRKGSRVLVTHGNASLL